MNKFIPDNIKFAKDLLADVAHEGYERVVKYHNDSIIQERLKDLLAYVEKLEALPEIIEDSINAKKALENSLDVLKEMCEDNHK
jgi:hypothetical protein